MTTTTRKTILPGAYISSDRRVDKNTRTLMVIDDTEGIIQEKDAAAGWQLAEFLNTGFRYFVRVRSTTVRVRNWSGTQANNVELRQVDTVVVDGALWAGVGEDAGLGLVRSELVI